MNLKEYEFTKDEISRFSLNIDTISELCLISILY